MSGEIQNTQQNAVHQLEYILMEQEKSAFQFEANSKKLDQEIALRLEAQRKRLDEREKELEEREAQIENKRRKLHSEKIIMEDKEKLQKRIVELEMLQLSKQVEFGALEDLNRELRVDVQKSDGELQQVRKELIHFMKNMSSGTSIGVKKMGKLDCKLFLNATKKKYYGDEAEDKAIELCSLWEDNLWDFDWNPFRTVKVKDRTKEVVNEKDVKLEDLKNELGDEVYFAVTTALLEMNEHTGVRSKASELWNFREGRKATVMEGVSYALKRWGLLMQNKN